MRSTVPNSRLATRLSSEWRGQLYPVPGRRLGLLCRRTRHASAGSYVTLFPYLFHREFVLFGDDTGDPGIFPARSPASCDPLLYHASNLFGCSCRSAPAFPRAELNSQRAFPYQHSHGSQLCRQAVESARGIVRADDRRTLGKFCVPLRNRLIVRINDFLNPPLLPETIDGRLCAKQPGVRLRRMSASCCRAILPTSPGFRGRWRRPGIYRPPPIGAAGDPPPKAPDVRCVSARVPTHPGRSREASSTSAAVCPKFLSPSASKTSAERRRIPDTRTFTQLWEARDDGESP